MTMSNTVRIAVAFSILAAVACGSSPPPSLTEEQLLALLGGDTKWITANGLALKAKTYLSRVTPGSRPTVVLVLHGDSPIGRPTIQDVFARRASEQLTNVVVVGLLRPGYTDGAGHTSDGERGRATGDNYTPQVIDAVRDVITALRKEYDAGRVVLVGHSGGAAIAANLLGRWPEDVNAALLISCPCNVWAWRTHMMKSYLWPYGPMALVFKLPTDSVSPLDLADRVSPRVTVRMLVGEHDDVAPPSLTREYEAALKRHGANVRVTVAPGLPHDILLEPVAFQELRELVDPTEQEPAQ